MTVDIAQRYRNHRVAGARRQEALRLLGEETGLPVDGVKLALSESPERQQERLQRRRERAARLAAKRLARHERARGGPR